MAGLVKTMISKSFKWSQNFSAIFFEAAVLHSALATKSAFTFRIYFFLSDSFSECPADTGKPHHSLNLQNSFTDRLDSIRVFQRTFHAWMQVSYRSAHGTFAWIKLSMNCIGQVRYKATIAIMSSISSFNSRRYRFIPADSSWNTPVVSHVGTARMFLPSSSGNDRQRHFVFIKTLIIRSALFMVMD